MIPLVHWGIGFFVSISNIWAQDNTAKIKFWNTVKKGANIFNRNITLRDIKEAKNMGLQFFRLAPDKFVSAHRDFLMRNANHYRGLVQEDLKKLKVIVDMCYKEGILVVITMLSLPGSRWKQNNQDKDDLRIWTQHKYQIQAGKFWQDLAKEFKDHPGIVGYNILNEPHPERLFKSKKIPLHTVRQEKVQHMMYNLYQGIILQEICDILGMPTPKNLEIEMVNRQPTKGIDIRTPLKLQDCIDARDSLAKDLYNKMF